MYDKNDRQIYFNINIIIFLFYYFFFITVASTPDWVAEFAAKQAKQEAEDRIKVSCSTLHVFD